MKHFNKVIYILLFTIISFNYAEKYIPTEEDLEKISEIKSAVLMEGVLSDENELSPEQIAYNQNWFTNFGNEAKILNYLKFNDGDIERTMAHLKRTLEWRRTNKIDGLQTNYTIPEWIMQNLPYNFTGYTDDGYPVLYVNFGKWDIREAIARNYREDILKTIMKLIDQSILDANKRFTKNDQNPLGIGQLWAILNWDDLSLYQASSIRVVSTAASFARIAESHYTEGLITCYCVNTPRFFVQIFNVLNQILNSKSLKIVKIYGKNDFEEWQKEIFSILPANTIPKILGGKF